MLTKRWFISHPVPILSQQRALLCEPKAYMRIHHTVRFYSTSIVFLLIWLVVLPFIFLKKNGVLNLNKIGHSLGIVSNVLEHYAVLL